MNAAIRYSTSHLLILICVFSLAPRLNSQPAAGGIVTRNVPFSSPIADSAGNLYFTGSVAPGQITPSQGAPQAQPGGGSCFASVIKIVLPRPCDDAFLEKTDSAGKIIFATYIGGPNDDVGSKIGFDSEGNIYVAGFTGGSFPTTSRAPVPATNGRGAFVAKFSPDGRLLYSTYLPGCLLSSSAVDGAGNAYLAGITDSNHAFVTKLRADGSAFLYNTVIAGSSSEAVLATALDPRGNITLSGVTTSADLPVTGGVLQPRMAGLQNAFVARLDSDGKIVFCTYLGGSGRESGDAIQLDAAGNIYVAGGTTSLDFPTTPGVFQPAALIPAWGSSPGGFVTKLTPDARALIYSTYFTTDRAIPHLVVNSSGEAYVATTTAAGFPITANAPQPCFGGSHDIVVAHLSGAGLLLEATYFGGGGDDLPYRLSVSDDGAIQIAALIQSTVSVQQPVIAQIRFGAPGWSAPACLSPDVLNAATFAARNISPGQLVSLTGFGIGPDAGVAYQPGPEGQAPLALGGVQVFFDGQAAPLIYAQSRQINAITPVELDGRNSTTILVKYNGMSFGPIVVPVTFAAPELFRLNAGVSTQAAAINQDGTVNSASNPAPRGSVVSLFGTGFGLTDPSCVSGALNPPAAVNLRATESTAPDPPTPDKAQILYAGGAPRLLCGIQQINLRIPDQAPSLNAMPVAFQVLTSLPYLTHSEECTGGTTIAVK